MGIEEEMKMRKRREGGGGNNGGKGYREVRKELFFIILSGIRQETKLKMT